MFAYNIEAHMDAHYGGKNESPGKAKARTWGYAALKRPQLYSGYHIVIASRDCGDIRYLLSCGVHADHIKIGRASCRERV